MMGQATDPENVKKVPADLLIGMFCGEDDSAGGFGKGPKAALEMYQKYGKSASLKLYLGARHEVLNETNKEKVYRDVLAFIDAAVSKT